MSPRTRRRIQVVTGTNAREFAATNTGAYQNNTDDRAINLRENTCGAPSQGFLPSVAGGKTLSPLPHKSRALVGVGGWGKS